MAAHDIYELGEIPPQGHIPRHMWAGTVRPERFGKPLHAFGIEAVEVPPVGDHQVLVYMMAAGINYNGIWAALAKPISMIAFRQKRGEKEDFHIGGSEGAGIVWAIGDKVKNVKPGDHVILSSCSWDPYGSDILEGADPITSRSGTVWGYEDNWGSFAQFGLVDDLQCFPKAPHLTWEEASCFMGAGATAYRQLCGWPPHTVKPGDPVLIWGAAGGLGSLAVQITREFGGIPIAVVSGEARAEYCIKLGAKGAINRTEFDHWGALPNAKDTEASARWTKSARAFGKKFWEVLGERRNPRIVFEHSGEDTLPTSIFICDNGGMVVTCGGTSGYIGDVDLRYLWMRQKRLQGSHFATRAQCGALNRLVAEGRIDSRPSKTWKFAEIGEAHQAMHENRHPPGNMAMLVNAPCEGLKDVPR